MDQIEHFLGTISALPGKLVGSFSQLAESVMQNDLVQILVDNLDTIGSFFLLFLAFVSYQLGVYFEKSKKSKHISDLNKQDEQLKKAETFLDDIAKLSLSLAENDKKSKRILWICALVSLLTLPPSLYLFKKSHFLVAGIIFLLLGAIVYRISAKVRIYLNNRKAMETSTRMKKLLQMREKTLYQLRNKMDPMEVHVLKEEFKSSNEKELVELKTTIRSLNIELGHLAKTCEVLLKEKDVLAEIFLQVRTYKWCELCSEDFQLSEGINKEPDSPIGSRCKDNCLNNFFKLCFVLGNKYKETQKALASEKEMINIELAFRN